MRDLFIWLGIGLVLGIFGHNVLGGLFVGFLIWGITEA